MTTFSGGNLQNEALAKIGVFQNPETREYYYGGKIDADGKVSGDFKIIPTEEALELAKKVQDIEKVYTKGSIIDLLPSTVAHKDGAYLDEKGNIIPPQKIVQMAGEEMIRRHNYFLDKGANPDTAKDAASSLPQIHTIKYEQEFNNENKKPQENIAKFWQIAQKIIAGRIAFEANEQNGNKIPSEELQRAEFTPLIPNKSDCEVGVITPPNVGNSLSFGIRCKSK